MTLQELAPADLSGSVDLLPAVDQVPETLGPPPPPRARRVRRSFARRSLARCLRLLRPTEGKVAFVVAAIPLTAFAVFMSLVRHMAFSDALTRLNNAEAVVLAYDPHAAAIGFVYGPLPSAVMAVFLPLAKIWPNLQIFNVIGSVETALFAAGTFAVVVLTARDLLLPRWARYGFAAAIILHPTYLVYASNGMAEGINLFFLALTARYVLRWLDPGTPSRNRDLLYAGLAVSGAYLSRVEGAAAGFAIILLVGAVSLLRTRGSITLRRQVAATDAVLIGAPFLFTFTVWALTSKLIVGKFIQAYGGKVTGPAQETLTKQFGGAQVTNRLDYLSKQVLGMQPLLVVAVVALLLYVLARRDWRGLVPLATFGASLSVDVLQLVQGNSFANLRYFLMVIPLTLYGFMLFAALPSDRLRPTPRTGLFRGFGRRYGPVVTLSSLIGVGLAATGPIAGYKLVHDPVVSVQEYPWWNAALHGDKALPGPDVKTWGPDRAVAAAVDALDTPPGSVLIDAAAGSAVLAGSRDRNKFLANADRSWEAALIDPTGFHIRYLVVSDGTGLSGDALVRSYPGVFQDGAGFAEKIGDFSNWRLFKVLR